jgi:excisionase family DNA binding protein
MEPRQHPRITRDDVMTAAEVADMLNLSRAAVYRLANTGQLPAVRLGRTVRFLRESVEAVLRVAKRSDGRLPRSVVCQRRS